MSLYHTMISRTSIDKGWSDDRKYHAITSDGTSCLLRISSADRLARKQQEFSHMQAAAALGIPMCLPLEFGTCEEGGYTIHSWVQGRDLEPALLDMDPATRYRYGLDAGRILRKIHSLPAPADLPDWETRFGDKIRRKIAMYQSCPLKYDKGDAFIAYLERNRHILRDRPQTYQHGDYHIGNMMLDEQGVLIIIDFDRDDFGDPWEEFNRIVWCAQAAPDFAAGMVDGYFDQEVPMAFWQLLALYISSNTLSSLPWAVSYGEAEIRVMQAQAAQVLEWYEDMTNVVPTWYRSRSGG